MSDIHNASHGTTIVCVAANDGIVIGADSKATSADGTSVMNKLREVGNCIVACEGLGSFGSTTKTPTDLYEADRWMQHLAARAPALNGALEVAQEIQTSHPFIEIALQNRKAAEFFHQRTCQKGHVAKFVVASHAPQSKTMLIVEARMDDPQGALSFSSLSADNPSVFGNSIQILRAMRKETAQYNTMLSKTNGGFERFVTHEQRVKMKLGELQQIVCSLLQLEAENNEAVGPPYILAMLPIHAPLQIVPFLD